MRSQNSIIFQEVLYEKIRMRVHNSTVVAAFPRACADSFLCLPSFSATVRPFSWHSAFMLFFSFFLVSVFSTPKFSNHDSLLTSLSFISFWVSFQVLSTFPSPFYSKKRAILASSVAACVVPCQDAFFSRNPRWHVVQPTCWFFNLRLVRREYFVSYWTRQCGGIG